MVLWLLGGTAEKLSTTAQETLLNANEVRVGPMVGLELQLLYEIDRIDTAPSAIFAQLGAQIGLRVCDARFDVVVREAEKLAWTRDPFDRLIVAQAAVAAAPLITKDGVIRKNYTLAIW